MLFAGGLFLGGVCGSQQADAARHPVDAAEAQTLPGNIRVGGLPSAALTPERFQSRAPSANGTATVPVELHQKWGAVRKEIQAERRVLARCRQQTELCSSAARRFMAVIDRALSRDATMRIAEINRTINLTIRPFEDIAQYGVVEKWTSPLTTFASGAGDCEDYAIAKYTALLEIGVAPDDVRLMVIEDDTPGRFHAVAAVRSEGHWLVLDNRTSVIQDASLSKRARYVLSGQGVRSVATAPAARPVAPVPVKFQWAGPSVPYLF